VIRQDHIRKKVYEVLSTGLFSSESGRPPTPLQSLPSQSPSAMTPWLGGELTGYLSGNPMAPINKSCLKYVLTFSYKLGMGNNTSF
jgi:hypothetical protein